MGLDILADQVKNLNETDSEHFDIAADTTHVLTSEQGNTYDLSLEYSEEADFELHGSVNDADFETVYFDHSGSDMDLLGIVETPERTYGYFEVEGLNYSEDNTVSGLELSLFETGEKDGYIRYQNF